MFQNMKLESLPEIIKMEWFFWWWNRRDGHTDGPVPAPFVQRLCATARENIAGMKTWQTSHFPDKQTGCPPPAIKFPRQCAVNLITKTHSVHVTNFSFFPTDFYPVFPDRLLR